MSYPDDYPDDLKESIFAHEPDSGSAPGDGALCFVFTRGGGRLNVYVLQRLGHVDGRDLPGGEHGGDVYLPADRGTVADTHYNPRADDSFVPEDMTWHNERPRLSQPVRDWMRSRDMLTADRDTLLSMIASEKNFDLQPAWL